MPYPTLDSLPDAVKKLPKHGQEIYQKAFNSAFDQYDGDEGKAAGTAWTAVKMKYKKNEDGTWVAKEAKEAATMLSMEDKRKLLQSAISEQLGISREDYFYVQDIYDGEVIYNAEDKLFKVGYVIDEESKVTLGTPVEVVQQTTYKPLEALQTKYAEIIQEVGKRNAKLDAARVKKIQELCQELLSDEAAADEKKTKEALKEATKVLAWLREQQSMKTEDGVQYPAEAFAYVPNPDDPSTWKLRLWESPEMEATKKQLKISSTFLSEGGYAGKRVAIASVDMPAVMRKIRAEYRRLGVVDEDIPKWVKTPETRELLKSCLPLKEAKLDKGRATVIVIQAGFNATEDRYYPADMLKRDYKIFEGQKMYADHPTETEDKERPERSIRDWVGTLVDVTVDESGTITGVAEIIEPWLLTKLASLRDKEMLSEMGISINAVGSASEATIDGKKTLVIEKLEFASSVDFVTEPGAGGLVTFYEADRRQNVDLVDLSALRERRPDLIKAIESEVRAQIQTEVKHKMDFEEQIKEKDTQIEALTKERDTLQEAAEKAVKDKAIADSQATVKDAVEKAEPALPQAAQERILERFKDSETSEGIEEAITSERDYIAKLAESGKVKGLGPSGPATEETKTALRESYKKLHPEYTEEQLDTACAGR